MIGASKILTVSYGTFSCTLEGFDDPFNTMRAIAEYFRDLAAEDRYFGAEPPTPDAAMLLKIAEREVQRRVEAKIQDNGVVLRTGEAVQTAFAPEPQPKTAPMVAQPVVEPVRQTAPPPAPMPDGVAAKLLRIRAAVANAERVEPVAEVLAPAAIAPVETAPQHPILADYSEDQHADDIGTSSTLAATFAPEAFDAYTVDAEVWSGPETALPDTAFEAVEIAAEPAPVTASDDDAPIVIDTSADIEFDWIDQPEPEDDSYVSTAADDSLLSSLANLSTTPAIADDADIDAAEDAAEIDPDDYAISDDDLADLRALDGDAADDVAPVLLTEDEDLAAPADAAAEGLSLSDFEDEIAENTPIIHSDPVIEEIDSAYDAPDAATGPGPSEKALRARARVIKVRRDDTAAAPAAATPNAESDVAAMLAAEAEADLRRELRAIQQQTAATMPAQSDDSVDDAGPEDDARQRLDDAGEAAVSRLIEQTNEVMAVPENRRRLSAIAHLKAAVAATVADRFAKGASATKETETKRLDPYREDLARVVRPQEPSASDDAVAAPRPAPLVLVSAQRIDRPRTAPKDSAPSLTAVPNAPVRPRRVTSAVLAVEPTAEIDEDDEELDAASIFTDARGFAEFSERLGANSLAEILEAAAAYSVCVEGRPYFSRPQLMSQIGALSSDSEYSREDGLRTFGALLREGRIQKIKRGQFVLTESSRYLSEARNLAG